MKFKITPEGKFEVEGSVPQPLREKPTKEKQKYDT